MLIFVDNKLIFIYIVHCFYNNNMTFILLFGFQPHTNVITIDYYPIYINLLSLSTDFYSFKVKILKVLSKITFFEKFPLFIMQYDTYT